MITKLWPFFILFVFPLMGGLIAFYTNKEFKSTIRVFLAFSGSFLFSITLLNFLPEVFHHIGKQAGFWVLGGFFFQILLEHFTHGVEHGHAHTAGLKNIWVVFLGLGIHAFLEGIPVGGYANDPNVTLSNGLLFGVALHEMPAAFVLIIALRSAQVKNLLIWIVIYALFCPVGAVLGSFVSGLDHDLNVFQIILAFIAGTFLHISTTILFENSDNHRFPVGKILAIVAGIGLAIVTQLL